MVGSRKPSHTSQGKRPPGSQMPPAEQAPPHLAWGCQQLSAQCVEGFPTLLGSQRRHSWMGQPRSPPHKAVSKRGGALLGIHSSRIGLPTLAPSIGCALRPDGMKNGESLEAWVSPSLPPWWGHGAGLCSWAVYSWGLCGPGQGLLFQRLGGCSSLTRSSVRPRPREALCWGGLLGVDTCSLEKQSPKHAVAALPFERQSPPRGQGESAAC